MPTLNPTWSQDLPIVEFRVEPGHGELASSGSLQGVTSPRNQVQFQFLFRRRFGGAGIGIVIVLVGMACFGLIFFGGFITTITIAFVKGLAAGNATPATRPTSGPPICCVPFFAIFLALWLRPLYLGLRGYWHKFIGREAWRFTQIAVVPPRGFPETSSLVTLADTRAGLCNVNDKWVIGISSGPDTLMIGPIQSEELAQQIEAALRKCRPAWFADAQGQALDFGVPDDSASQKLPDGPPEIIESCEIQKRADGFDLVLRRAGSPARRKGRNFFFIWLAGWAVGEIFTGKFVVETVLRFAGALPPIDPPAKKGPPLVFLALWLTGWTIGGIWAMRMLYLRFRRHETWQFRDETIVAGANWQRATTRRLKARKGRIAVVLRTVASYQWIWLICGGHRLEIGPIADPRTAQRLIGELRALRPMWKWPDAGDAGAKVPPGAVEGH